MQSTDKIQAAIEQLTAEQQRRAQEKAATGEVLVIRDFHAVGETIEQAEALLEARKAQEIARLRAGGETREIVFDEETTIAVATGVPSSPGQYQAKPDANEISSEPALRLGEPVAREVVISPPQPAHVPPQYVRVQLQRPRDGFPGRIAEGMFEVRGDNVVLTDMDGEIIGGRQLLQGEDPAFVARELLRARHAGDEFSETIHYPSPSGIA